jgi:polysaccharide biosynthesis transport protein
MQQSSLSDLMTSSTPILLSRASGDSAIPSPKTYSAADGLPGHVLAPLPRARQRPTLSELVNALKRRLVLAAFLGMLVAALTGTGIWLAMPAGKHQVSALLEMRSHEPILGERNTSTKNFEEYKYNQIVLMKTRPLLAIVVHDDKVKRTKYIMESDDPIRDLEGDLRTRWEAPSLLHVSLNGDDPLELKLILDRWVLEYVEQTKTDERLRTRTQLKKIEEEIARVEGEIETIESENRRGARVGGIDSPIGSITQLTLLGQRSQTLHSQIDTMNREIRQATENLVLHKATLERLKDLPVEAAEVETIIRESDVYATKAAQVAKQEELFVQERGWLQPGAPLLIRSESELQQARKGLSDLIQQFRPTAEAKWRALQEKSLRTKIALAEASLQDGSIRLKTLVDEKTEVDRNLAESVRVNEEMQRNNAKLLPYLNQRETLNNERIGLITRMGSQPTVTIKEEPAVTFNQNLKQKVLLSIAGATVGFGLILLAVAFLEWRSRRIDSVEQAVNDLGIRVLGTIPAFPSKASLKNEDTATSQNWRFMLNESVNAARTMLLHTAKSQNMQVLMVTSAMQGEGKTSLSSQLATSMASVGLRTLILDGDLRNPSMHTLFDTALSPGFAEVLCQEIDVSDVVQPTSVPNLWIVPAGLWSNQVIAALAQGDTLKTLFTRLRSQFDFVMMDTGPILPVAEALLFGQHVDGVVFSILQDISQLPKVQNALEKLMALNIPLLGAVVNGITPDVHAYGYNSVKQSPP